jgi:hypothetical protein
MGLPNNKEHCEDSLRRYGKTFEELHRWMDEPSAIMGASHRKYRHDPYTTPQEAKKLFGENADHACLDHIRLDELESRKKVFGKTSTSAVPNPFIGVISLILAVILFFTGIYLFSSASLFRSGAWAFIMMGIVFIVGSVIFGLVFIGSFIQPKQSSKKGENGDGQVFTYNPECLIFCVECGTQYDYTKLSKCPNCGKPWFTQEK